VAGSNNDINVLDQSPLFDDVVNGTAPDTSFDLRGVRYKRDYYLGDGIYAEYSTIVKSLTAPEGPRCELYKQAAHDGARKDIERAFARLKSKWHIISNLRRLYSQLKIRKIMKACCILHNMTLEDDRLTISQYNPNVSQQTFFELTGNERQANRNEMRNRQIHF
jgi:hypothetical protein